MSLYEHVHEQLLTFGTVLSKPASIAVALFGWMGGGLDVDA